MKNYFKYLLTAFTLLFALAACDEEMNKETEVGEGTLTLSSMNFKLEVDTEEVLVTKAGTEINTYTIRILDNTENVVESFVYSQMPEIITLKVGDYKMEAHSQELSLQTVSSDPYYYGSTSFSIKENQITTIDKIKCTFQSVKVEVLLTDDLKNKLEAGYSTKVSMGNVSYTFTATNSDHTYFPVQADETKNILILLMEGKIDGEDVYVTNSYSNVKAGEYRKITIDLQTNGIDDNEEWLSEALKMKVDATCKIITKDIDIPVEEDIIEPEDPGTTDPGVEPENPIKIVGRRFDISQPQTIPLGGTTVIVDMTVDNGIKNLFVTIDSPLLTPEELQSINLAANFDLVTPGQYEEGLRTLKLPVADEVYGKIQLAFDISEFTQLLNYLGDGSNNFILTVVDLENNRHTETLTLVSQFEEI